MIIKEIHLSYLLINQLIDIFQSKFSKGDIQALFAFSDLDKNNQEYQIEVNLKQLFIIIEALKHFSDRQVSIEERISIITLDPKDNQGRQLFIKVDGTIVKEITHLGATIDDVRIRNDAALIENNWKKE